MNAKITLPVTDREEIFGSTYAELQKTIENQLAAYHNINQRAVDLAKIDLLTLSVIVTGLSLSELAMSVPLLGGLLSLLYALWCCAKVFEPRSLAGGLAAESVNEIKARSRDGLTVAEHYENIMFSYQRAIASFSESHREVKTIFRNAIWSSLAAITFFAVVAVRRMSPEYPYAYDLVWVVIIPVVMLWGKDKYGDDQRTEHG